ncbi:MAG: alpha/beta hydrolase [Flavobacteriaceae bacterium]|nr:alpha/beta hydrolase [Flavobacteriaceae bacterium]
MRILKKILKITIIILVVLFTGLLIAAHMILKPRSDEKIIEKLQTAYTNPVIHHKTFGDYEYRTIHLQKKLDTTLPILIFAHGSPGSTMDFKRYLKDSLLNARANIITYERIGYGPRNHGKTPANMAVELSILHDVIDEYPEGKVVLAGYSYGGSVILASEKSYKYKVSMASAVVGEYEPMFKTLSFYKWKLTRWLLPPKVKAAAKEKYAHVEEFPRYKDKWNRSPSKVINIHGDKDWIVPYKNSEFLQEIFDQDKFTMVTIPGGGHELIWSDFELIKAELLKTLN